LDIFFWWFRDWEWCVIDIFRNISKIVQSSTLQCGRKRNSLNLFFDWMLSWWMISGYARSCVPFD
jgi:hypothetical protein